MRSAKKTSDPEERRRALDRLRRARNRFYVRLRADLTNTIGHAYGGRIMDCENRLMRLRQEHEELKAGVLRRLIEIVTVKTAERWNGGESAVADGDIPSGSPVYLSVDATGKVRAKKG